MTKKPRDRPRGSAAETDLWRRRDHNGSSGQIGLPVKVELEVNTLDKFADASQPVSMKRCSAI